MSRIIIAYLFSSLLESNCNCRVDFPYEYSQTKESDEDLANYLEPRRFNDHFDDNDAKELADIVVDERPVTSIITKSTKTWLTIKSAVNPADVPAGLRTDVVFRLREKLQGFKASLDVEADYKYVSDPWSWPVISFKTELTQFILPTPPSRTARTFRDHFETIKYNKYLRISFTPKIDTLPNTDSSYNQDILSETYSYFTEDFPTWNQYVWKQSYLATTSQLPSYRSYSTKTNLFPVKTNRLSKKSLSTTLNKFTEYTDKSQISLFFPSRLTKSLSTTLKKSSKYDKFRFGLRFPNRTTKLTVTNEVFKIPSTRLLPLHEFMNDEFITEPFHLRDLLKPTPEPTTTTTTTPTITTTTTTISTRSIRAYPYPKWICFECGRNETKFGSSFCHDVFETHKDNVKRLSLHYKCNGNKSAAYQCFKRFLDIGYYNERGCRDFPPRRSGKTFVSKRLRALEEMLYDVKDGCIFSPHAALVPFSRSIQLYARFHVCVCSGTLCNNALEMSSQTWLIFSMAMFFTIIST